MKVRLDTFLHSKGFFESRNKAATAITGSRVIVNGVLADKPSLAVQEDSVITILEGDHFVSRAYQKLSAALDKFGVIATEATALDIGASTGGFTQCLLEQGAKKVFAVDVGSGQLHPSLKNDSRVVNMESTNARDLKKDSFPEEISLVVMDVSFISQSKLYPAVSDILSTGGNFISLVKPQFEVGRSNIGKNGIVKDKDGKLIASVKEFLSKSAAELHLKLIDFTNSPITGGDGNKEYLAFFIKQ